MNADNGNQEWIATEPILGAWYRRARESQFAHYAAAGRYSRLSRLLGVPSVALSAAAGTTLFATLQKDEAPQVLRLIVGLATLLVAMLAALQTFLGLSERADKHRRAASAYGAIRREIEQYQALPPTSCADVTTAVVGLRKRLDEIASSAPDVPKGLWEGAQKEIDHTDRPEGFRKPSPPGPELGANDIK